MFAILLKSVTIPTKKEKVNGFATFLLIPCLQVQCKYNEYSHLHNEYVALQCAEPSPSTRNQANAIKRAQQSYEELPIGYPVQVDEGSIDLPATREQ